MRAQDEILVALSQGPLCDDCLLQALAIVLQMELAQRCAYLLEAGYMSRQNDPCPRCRVEKPVNCMEPGALQRIQRRGLPPKVDAEEAERTKPLRAEGHICVIPSGTDAWRGSPTIRDWFEVVFDVTTTPHSNTAYICKCCWQQFRAGGTDPFRLEGHALLHTERGERPYATDRLSFLSGEHILESHRLVNEHFAVVTPEVGTWKFECRCCRRRFPHRSDCRDLIHHGLECFGRRAVKAIQ